MLVTTTDGKIFRMIVCTCGRQNTAGICEHVENPVYVEKYVQLPSYQAVDGNWRDY